LRLVDLTSEGLRRLDVSRARLIESDARCNAETAAWAQALHAHREHVDGLTWVYRQDDTSRALVLFGDRVEVAELLVAEGCVPLHLGSRRRP
ncbi:MAG TPA: hypothetical protein VFJ14_02885, partial [Nocardioidaceae bacterium]|nr:hypothetical protein [Nocardioidaceae bacterium]